MESEREVFIAERISTMAHLLETVHTYVLISTLAACWQEGGLRACPSCVSVHDYCYATLDLVSLLCLSIMTITIIIATIIIIKW